MNVIRVISIYFIGRLCLVCVSIGLLFLWVVVKLFLMLLSSDLCSEIRVQMLLISIVLMFKQCIFVFQMVNVVLVEEVVVIDVVSVGLVFMKNVWQIGMVMCQVRIELDIIMMLMLRLMMQFMFSSVGDRLVLMKVVILELLIQVEVVQVFGIRCMLFFVVSLMKVLIIVDRLRIFRFGFGFLLVLSIFVVVLFFGNGSGFLMIIEWCSGIENSMFSRLFRLVMFSIYQYLKFGQQFMIISVGMVKIILVVIDELVEVLVCMMLFLRMELLFSRCSMFMEIIVVGMVVVMVRFVNRLRQVLVVDSIIVSMMVRVIVWKVSCLGVVLWFMEVFVGKKFLLCQCLGQIKFSVLKDGVVVIV